MEKFSAIQKQAKLSGTFFILAIIAGILAAINWDPINEAEHDLSILAQNEMSTIISVLLITVMAFSTAMIAIPLFPILRKYNEGLALVSVASRIMESVMTLVMLVFIMGMLGLSQEYTATGLPTNSYYEILNSSLFHMSDWASHFQVMFFNIGALFYCYIFFRSKLIPRWISSLGLIAVTLGFLDVMLMIFGFYGGTFNQYSVLLNLPTLFFELIIAYWLIRKGVNKEVYEELS